jgi:hypothetical protein
LKDSQLSTGGAPAGAPLCFPRTKAGADMNRLFSWFGIAMLIFLPARMIWAHGGRWEFGPHGIPVSALSADGKTYRNGDEIDPITEMMIRSGIEERVAGFAYGGLLLAVVVLAYEVRQYKQLLDSRARRLAAEGVREMAEQYEREGKHQEAQAAFEFYRQKLEAEVALWRRKRRWKRELDKAMERSGRTY